MSIYKLLPFRLSHVNMKEDGNSGPGACLPESRHGSIIPNEVLLCFILKMTIPKAHMS